MDLNPWLVLGPSGMLGVGIFAVLWWKKRHAVAFKFFVFGGILWAAAIVPKLIMDLTVTSPFYLWAASQFGNLWALAVLGIYVGLRTGFFECGAAYLGFASMRKKSSHPKGDVGTAGGLGYREAIAVGVGFGAFEAIVLAIPSLVQMAYIFLDPSILSMVPQDQALLIGQQLSQPTWTAAAAVWERAFTILAHVFATVLAYQSLVLKRPSLLGVGIAYKSVLDGPLPLLQASLASSPYYLVVTEAFVAIMGLIGLLGMLNMDRIAPRDGMIIRDDQ